MKIYPIVALAAFAAAAAFSAETNAPPMGTLAYMDWRNGFRDLRFGDALSNRADMVRQATTAQEIYTRKNEDLQIGGARATEIFYCAHHGKLCAISIMVDAGSYYSLRAPFAAAYGEPARDKDSPDEEFWLGSEVTASIMKNDDGTADLFLRNRELSKAEQAERAAAAAKKL
jgi:hypothetical protein